MPPPIPSPPFLTAALDLAAALGLGDAGESPADGLIVTPPHLHPVAADGIVRACASALALTTLLCASGWTVALTLLAIRAQLEHATLDLFAFAALVESPATAIDKRVTEFAFLLLSLRDSSRAPRACLRVGAVKTLFYIAITTFHGTQLPIASILPVVRTLPAQVAFWLAIAICVVAPGVRSRGLAAEPPHVVDAAQAPSVPGAAPPASNAPVPPQQTDLVIATPHGAAANPPAPVAPGMCVASISTVVSILLVCSVCLGASAIPNIPPFHVVLARGAELADLACYVGWVLVMDASIVSIASFALVGCVR